MRPTRLVLLGVLVAAIAAPQAMASDRNEPARDVRILRDTWGVPHVFGKTDADVAYGLAYAHAEDDFGQIQESVLMARGDLGRHKGMEGALTDYVVHLLRVRETVDARWETDLSEGTRRYLDAYAEGLAAYAARHPREVKRGFEDPTGKDIAAGFLLMTPIFVGLDRVLGDLMGETPPLRPGVPVLGSNTFAVAPGRSTDGHTRLAVNSHQPWEGPVAWYEAHLKSEEGLDIVGGVFPIAPMVLHGHNRDLGWAFTVNRPDVFDVYRLDMHPEDENRYRLDGEWHELERSTARLRVKILGPLWIPVKREVVRSVHGPAIRTEHGVYAIRSAVWGTLRAVEQWYRMNRATTFDEWKDAMRLQGIPSFNVGYADKAGNIFYVYNGLIPLRAAGQGWKGIVPGDRSELIWQDTLPFDALPQVENPASGFVQNCNSSPFSTTTGESNPDPARFPARLGIETRMTNRALRALELFGSDTAISREEFDRYKFDMRYSPASRAAHWLTRAQEAATDDPELRAAQAHLAAWDRSTHPESDGAALGVLTLRPLVLQELGRLELLPTPLEALTDAVEELRRHHGRLDVPWSEVNRLRRGDLDLGLGGGPDVLHAVYASEVDDGRLIGMAGDSLVLQVEWDEAGRVSSRSIHQYGSATTREQSPHYDDQAPLFVKRELKPVWIDEADIRANLECEYVPGEEAGAGCR